MPRPGILRQWRVLILAPSLPPWELCDGRSKRGVGRQSPSGTRRIARATIAGYSNSFGSRTVEHERFLALHTDDVCLTVANYPTGAGKDALAAAIGGLWNRIKAMSHSIVSARSLHEGTVGIAETLCITRVRMTLPIRSGHAPCCGAGRTHL